MKHDRIQQGRALLGGPDLPRRPPVITECVAPPIPIRSYDWRAFYDGHEADDPYGWGAAEAEAINDLTDNHEIP